MEKRKEQEYKTAYFAGGCFWCIVPVFRELSGVSRVVSGYSGGIEINPTYMEVKKQLTGHRESICVEYNPSVIAYGKLLDIFLSNVDPFDEEGQFIDRGYSYTLAIYPQTMEEKEEAERKIRNLEEETGRKVMISVEAFMSFWNAEEEHQNYDQKNPEAFAQELIESGRAGREK